MKIEYQQYADTWKATLIGKHGGRVIFQVGLGKTKVEAIDNMVSNIAAKSDKTANAWAEATQTADEHLNELTVLNEAYDFLMNQGYEK